MIAPIGGDNAAVLCSLGQFPTEKVIILCLKEHKKKATALQKELNKLSIPYSTIDIGENIWEPLFRVLSELKKNKNILMNVGGADPRLKCASISASFVNGLKAFDVYKKKIIMLPIMKFSYYRMIPEKKMKILKFLESQKEYISSLDTLSKELKMSLPLVSYYVNGNPKTEGLKQMGLVDTKIRKGRVTVSLNTMSRLFSCKGMLTDPPSMTLFGTVATF
jgi:DNA-binding transcriptional ArsR family regulator